MVATPHTEHRPLAVALVGCGRWGTSLANALAGLPEFELRWVCDPRVKRDGCRWAPALSDAVCRDVDAVVVATPPELHLAPTLIALQGRRAVLVEKPFAQSLAEVRQIQAVQGRTPVMVGHLLAYHPGYQALMGWVKSRTAPLTVDVVRHSPARGNNRCPWWTLAPHDLALLTRLFGEPVTQHVVYSGNGVQAQLTWPVARANLSYSTVAATKDRHWRARSGSSSALFDELDGQLTLEGDVVVRTDFSAADPLRAELRHFASCVRGDVAVATGMVEAELSVRLLCEGETQLRRARRGGAGRVQPRETRDNP